MDHLRLLVRELRVSAKDAERTLGISGAQLFVLQCLTEREPCSLRELAETTHTDQSSVSVVVARLAERGLARRTASAEDARRVDVRLTAKGRRLVLAAPEAAQVRLARALAGLRPAVSVHLAAGLSALVSQMGLDGQPRMFFEEETTPKPRAKKKSVA